MCSEAVRAAQESGRLVLADLPCGRRGRPRKLGSGGPRWAPRASEVAVRSAASEERKGGLLVHSLRPDNDFG